MLNAIYQRIQSYWDSLEVMPDNVNWADAAMVKRLRDQGLSYPTLRYLALIDDTKDRTIFFSWNWAAFLFGPLWAVYRKAYLGAVLMWALSAMLSFGGFLGTLFAGFLFGVFADSYYFHTIRRNFYTRKNLRPSLVGVFVILLLIPIIITMFLEQWAPLIFSNR